MQHVFVFFPALSVHNGWGQTRDFHRGQRALPMMETVSFSTIATGEHAPVKDVGVGMEWHFRAHT